MSEYGKPKFEQRDHLLQAPEQRRALPDAEHAQSLRPGESDPLMAKKARQTAQETAQTSRNPFEHQQTAEPEQPSQYSYVNRELKSITLRRELKALRRQLPLPERWLSQAIHQPAVSRAGTAASQSLTRPSGLLGGGVVAFLGSLGYLYLAKHVGFTYNYLGMGLLFVVGFGLGLLLELVVWLLATRRRAD